ncbi:MAG: sigma-70 family RNA polymerase sigma factor [Alphaproteobacteria bacterium]|nr:sigma-70 family RNA polymerase sigma factor [Alphaproteobacteria bacterium]
MSALEKDTDESLMVRIQKADHRAFSVLVQRHTERFYALAFRTCSDQMMAEDIVQEAFLKLWKKPDSWNADKGAKFTTWFYRVVVNTAHDFGRKKRKEYTSEKLESFADESLKADEALHEAEQQEKLEEAVQALPERQKAALNLCFYEGLSNKEAADIMGVGVKALESLLMRAKTALKDELIRGGIIETPMKKETRYG